MSVATCPHCGYLFDRYALGKWGDGVQALSFAPLICVGCSAVMLLHIDTGKIEELPDWALKFIEQKNPALWQAIEEARAQLRAAREAMKP